MPLSPPSSRNPVASPETYYGLIETAKDAKIIIKACEIGLLHRLKHRLSENERSGIRSGSVFALETSSFGSWTDKKEWGRKTGSGDFSVNREITNQEGGLIRQSFSDQHYRIVSFYSRSNPGLLTLKRPNSDPSLKTVELPHLSHLESDIHHSNPVLSLIVGEMRQSLTTPQIPSCKNLKYTTPPFETNHAIRSLVHSAVASPYPASPSGPHQVLVDVRGDVANYLRKVKCKPQDIDLYFVTDGPLSVTRGDPVPKGWSIDYYGASDIRRYHGDGIGWRLEDTKDMRSLIPSITSGLLGNPMHADMYQMPHTSIDYDTLGPLDLSVCQQQPDHGGLYQQSGQYPSSAQAYGTPSTLPQSGGFGRLTATLAATGNTKSTIPPVQDVIRFPCSQCTKTYRRKDYLNRHLRVHKGDRPNKCKLCPKTFSRSDSLKRHTVCCSTREGNRTGASHLSQLQA